MADVHPLEFHLVGQADIDLAALVAGAWVAAADWDNNPADFAEVAVDIEAIVHSQVAHNAEVVVAAAAGFATVKPAALPGNGHGSSSTRLDHQ